MSDSSFVTKYFFSTCKGKEREHIRENSCSFLKQLNYQKEHRNLLKTNDEKLAKQIFVGGTEQ